MEQRAREDSAKIRQRNKDDESKLLKQQQQTIASFQKKWKASEVGEINDPSIQVRDFYLMKTIGKGAYGRVMLCQHRVSQQMGAMKIMDKKRVTERKKAAMHLRNEKRILDAVDMGFMTRATFMFEDNSNIYIIMEFAAGGDLFSLMRDQGPFKETVAKFYACEVALALDYMHSCSLVHRDLKPENLLVMANGHVKMTDYGFSCMLSGNSKAMSVLGTPEYMAPEILHGRGYDKCVDWWAYGILIYELSTKYTPFAKAGPGKVTKETLMRKIRDEKPEMPSHVGSALKSLLKQLLERDVSSRLCCRAAGFKELKDHEWFNEVEWLMAYNMNIASPFLPVDHLQHDADTKFFDNQKEEKLNIK